MTNKDSLPAGEELKRRREELGYSLHKVEVATKIRGRYLRAIEASDFAHLPNDVYSRGFVRQYAQYLGLPGAELAKRYQTERGGVGKPVQQVKPRAVALRLGATSRWAASLAVLAILGLIIGYLVWQFSSLTSAPRLTVSSPTKDTVVDSASILINGETDPGSDIFLNDVALPSDVNGSFSTTLALQAGINEVRVVAKNKLGKETKITRNILSKQTKADQLPTASFDGVAVLITATEANSVKIVADNKTIYEGNLGKGSARLVSAKDTVVITASNPASVSAKLTNSVVSAYNFGPLGSEDTARTVEFTKTTKLSQ